MVVQPPKHFTDAIAVLSESQQKLLTKLYCELGQGDSLFSAETFHSGIAPSRRRHLASQLEEIDQEYQAGGLEGYITNARRLLKASKEGVNPLDGWSPSIPKGETFELGTDKYYETETKGLKLLGSCGFVLVAGGLGERLGYSGIKVNSCFMSGWLILIVLLVHLRFSIVSHVCLLFAATCVARLDCRPK
jgi:UDP-sugar pyrophosphorylase